MTQQVTRARLPTAAGEFQLHLFAGADGGKGHMALVRGDVSGRSGLLVRVHSECFTGEVLGSLRCDCGPQLAEAIRQIAAEGAGVIVYLRQEGRGIGLLDKLRAYNLQDAGHDTVDANLLLGHGADERDYSAAAEILTRLGLRSVRLLTNNPAKIEGLRRHGIAVSARVPTLLHVNAENAPYLLAKAQRMQHLLDLEPEVGAVALGSHGGTNGESYGAADPGGIASELMVAEPASSLRWFDGLAALRERIARHRAGPAARRPFVTLSYAQSVDGSIAASPDRPLALSGQASLTLTHGLRAIHDAILVGIGTVVADNPRLTVRFVDGAQPRPVVVDSRLRTPLDASLLSGGGVQPLIATTDAASVENERSLVAAGAEIVRLPADRAGRVSLTALLEHLARSGVRSVMVEGGAGIITSVVHERLLDHLVLTVAPLLVGGLRGVLDLGTDGFPRLRNLEYQQLHEDLVVWGDPAWDAC
jgi:3,4-dihydroxy 2-butanone 4-phosphate synthase/GTP cyclohydrolase II